MFETMLFYNRRLVTTTHTHTQTERERRERERERDTIPCVIPRQTVPCMVPCYPRTRSVIAACLALAWLWWCCPCSVPRVLTYAQLLCSPHVSLGGTVAFALLPTQTDIRTHSNAHCCAASRLSLSCCVQALRHRCILSVSAVYMLRGSLSLLLCTGAPLSLPPQRICCVYALPVLSICSFAGALSSLPPQGVVVTTHRTSTVSYRDTRTLSCQLRRWIHTS